MIPSKNFQVESIKWIQGSTSSEIVNPEINGQFNSNGLITVNDFIPEFTDTDIEIEIILKGPDDSLSHELKTTIYHNSIQMDRKVKLKETAIRISVNSNIILFMF